LCLASSLLACSQPDAPRAASRPAVRERTETAGSELRAAEGARAAARLAVDPARLTARGYDVVSYDLRGSFDWDAPALKATVAIALRLGDTARRSIAFDSRVTTVDRITASGVTLPFTADADAGLLTVDLTPLGPRAPRDLTVTIAYVARTAPGALTVASGVNGDPITSRVAFTEAEPLFGLYWMPGNHQPSDRARFSVALEMDAAEDMIANGRRLGDTPTAGGRKIVRYRMDTAIPTYIMAFAVGDLVHEEDCASGETPLSVWHRRGVRIASRTRLREIRSMMSTYERLLGPFPFDTYALVYLPQFGGMENASISFENEKDGQQADDFVTAHETAHQWFGDLITVADWEDLWIKEGMATLLQWEATRSGRDFERRGRLFGGREAFAPGDAIRMHDIDPNDRYTTGPYQRAAWHLTQIRALLGEAKFWDIVRRFLRAHAYQAVTSAQFLGAFTPYVDPSTAAKMAAALDATAEPTVAVEPTESNGQPALAWRVTDPQHVLIAPIELTTVDAEGAVTTFALTEETPVTLPLHPGGYIAIDERDVHPDLRYQMELDPDVYDTAIAPHLVPTAPKARARFFSRSAAAQEQALAAGPIATTPSGFAADHARLDSRDAHLASLRAGCSAMRDAADADRARWAAVVGRAMGSSDAPTPIYGGLPECGVDLPVRLFGAELSRLTGSFDIESSDRLSFLLSFDYGAPRTFDALAGLTTRPESEMLRSLAVTRLAAQADPAGGYSPVDANEAPRWGALFRAEIAKATTQQRLTDAFQGARGLRDTGALPLLAAKLATVTVWGPRATRLACGAYTLARSTDGAWDAFKAALPPLAQLPSEVRRIVLDPSTCPAPRE
jgi:hypothetical protein